ncbi:MAG: hypothetical protein KAI33_07375, partial [Elusimicrobiales bacterium]|nr:hypothetical protein [Elusimicrobiales bacterium]
MKKIFFWILSFIITVSFAYFQKITGPTYPIKNSLKYKESILNYHLPRSCTIGKNDCLIKIKIEEARQRVSAKGKEQRVEISELKSESDWVGTIVWRRYKTSDEWSFLEMDYADKELRACIEEQPPAGKIEYKVEIGDKKNKVLITQKSVITRFKGFVPPYVLIPHIIFMFL